MDTAKIEEAVRMILEAVGEDTEREGLLDTPKRVARMYQEILGGLKETPNQHLHVQFNEEHEEMVLVKDIPFHSLCEHHMLPFFGLAHVAYIPHGRVTGLSKLARVVEGFSRRLQLQERLTSQISDSIMEILQPKGVLVVIEAEHMCMTMRGIRKAGSKTLTSAVRGIFRTNQETRAEALSLIHSLREK